MAQPSVSGTFPIFQAKKLSWADRIDETERLHEICERDSITLEQFVSVIHSLLPKCEVDTTKTAHHYQIGSTYYDLMYRHQIVLAISHHAAPAPLTAVAEEPALNVDRGTPPVAELVESAASASDHPSDDDDEEDASDSSSSASSQSTASNEENEEDAEGAEPAAWTDVAEQTLALPTTEDGAGSWTKVESRRDKSFRSAQATVERLGTQVFYVFRNEANATYMDFVGVVQGLDALLEEACRHRWSHGYNVEENVVYDFYESGCPEIFRYFIPNTAYLHKFRVWFDAYQENGRHVPEDERVFYVFHENSTWPTWTPVGVYRSLSAARQAVVASHSHYGHAYCVETSDLVNFWLTDGHLRQTERKAPVKYLSRFEAYLDAEEQAFALLQ